MQVYLALFIASSSLLSAAKVDYDTPITELFINVAGSDLAYAKQFALISGYASSLRGGIPNYIDTGRAELQGTFGFISKLTFSDGVSWAVKVERFRDIKKIQRGLDALDAIHNFCPDLPVPRYHGSIQPLLNKSFVYYFQDWIDGSDLFDDFSFERDNSTVPHRGEEGDNPKRNEGTLPTICRFPEIIVSQLGEFVHNLTVCPIPDKESALYLNQADFSKQTHIITARGGRV
jgi:hypothetical protein